MMVPLDTLKGPFHGDAEAIILMALSISTADAERLVAAWDADQDMDRYLEACRSTWDALTDSERLLPLGWFEAIFADCAWVDSTKALHPIADAVVATLVQDIVTPDTFATLVDPWRVAMYASVN
jgi:hypothetical protein